MKNEVPKLENYRSADDYVKKVFIPAEDHAERMLRQAVWICNACLFLRRAARGEVSNEKLPLAPVPNKSFEELGREMDLHIQAINTKFPIFTK